MTYLDLLPGSFPIKDDRLHHAEVSSKELNASIKLLKVHRRPPVAIVSFHVAQTCTFAFLFQHLFAHFHLLHIKLTLLLRLNYSSPVYNYH